MSDPLSHTGRGLLGRRGFLRSGSAGLGGMALASLLGREKLLASAPPIRPLWSPEHPTAPRPPHFPPRASQVLVIFCSGALSHVDSWDYKPELIRRHDTPMPGSAGLVTFQGANGNLIKPLWEFRPRGQSGKMISDMLPHLASQADELCFLHSMTAKSNTHGPAENQMSTGFTLDGFPSMGSWVSYALGSENENLPAFVAIPDPRGVPQIGPNHWNSAFLPAAFQGTPFNADKPIPNLAAPSGLSRAAERGTRDLLRFLNDRHLAAHPGDEELSARIASYEMAARMQLSASEAGDFSKESADTLKRYSIGESNEVKSRFGRNCLLARRLLERGVRFVQLFNGSYAMGEGVGNWDGHKTLKTQYDIHREVLDEPCAALLEDLRRSGLMDQTVVAFVSEFGRMPTFQKGASGRDHNPAGFTVWLTGAGVKRAFSYGSTDAFGYRAEEHPLTLYDLHATLLHLLGLDHERLSFYHNGIERRLTDVHGEVIKDILA